MKAKAEEILALGEKATRRPWTSSLYGVQVLTNDSELALFQAVRPDKDPAQQMFNADYIVAACNNAPALAAAYLEQEAALEKVQRDWDHFEESIAPLIECEPEDIQDMGYILNSVAAMQEEERDYSGIADELVKAEAALALQAGEMERLKRIEAAAQKIANSDIIYKGTRRGNVFHVRWYKVKWDDMDALKQALSPAPATCSPPTCAKEGR